MTRDEADKLYVDWIMSDGNPAYFVWAVVRQWSDAYLQEKLADDYGEEIEIEDEE